MRHLDRPRCNPPRPRACPGGLAAFALHFCAGTHRSASTNRSSAQAARPPRQARGRGGHSRRGLSLLEIILALAIFFGSLAALSQLGWSGARATVQARLKTQAIIRCEAKLAEVLAGAEVLQPKSGVSFFDNPAWTWSLSITPTPYKGLLQVDVTVSHGGGKNRLANAEFHLRRWMREPSLFTDAALKLKDSEEQTNGIPPATSSSSTTTK